MDTTCLHPSFSVPSRLPTTGPAKPAMRFALPAGRTKAFDALRGRTAVRIEAGEVWLTQSGHAQDIVLIRTDRFVCESTGRVVVEALTDAVVSVFEQE